MMFHKKAEFRFNELEALNKPKFTNDLDFIKDQDLSVNEQRVNEIISKIASANENDKNGDGQNSSAFDLQSEISAHPDSLFIKCFAIKAEETNDNGDYFSREELIKAVPTFVGVPLFTNHANTDINEARGKVVHSWWDNEKNGIMIIGRVDAEAYPQLARGIKEEYVIGTSMGCQVQYSLCSICHNYAETPDSYCECIRERKTRHITSRKQECHYHDNGPDDNCPICGCAKGISKKYAVDSKVFEHNYGIKFIENSFVVNPACADCGVTEVIDPHKFIAKVAKIEGVLPRLLKAAAEKDIMCTDQKCYKLAGQAELDSLNQALDLMTSVSKSMLDQKEQIDLEFLSDLVKVVADLQTTIDELTEQGYGRLQSPGQPPESGQQPEMITQNTPEVTNMVQPPAAPVPSSKIHTGPAGQVGNVTSPLANVKIINLEKLASEILTRKKLEIPDLKVGTSKQASSDDTAPSKPAKQVKLAFQMPRKDS